MVTETQNIDVSDEQSYALAVGMVYSFNLMMGAGVLALPKSFVQVGWILGVSGMALLAFTSFITVTFVIEVQSVYNALQNHRSRLDTENQMEMYHSAATANANETSNENSSGIDLYEITMKTELCDLCNVFLNKLGCTVFYFAFCFCLYGSLAVNSAAVAKSLTSLVCQDHISFHVKNDTASCSLIPQLTLMQSYRLSLALFVVFCCPFVFFEVAKTRILQLLTIGFRCFALSSMMFLALRRIINGNGAKTPKLADFSKLSDFIGTSMFTFMCQDSIATTLAPIRNKEKINVAMPLTFFLVLLFSACLTLTAVYAFHPHDVQDLYTLTFTNPEPMKYIFEFFPVLTLGANFPIAAVVLRDNIKKLFLRRREEDYGLFLRKILFPLVAISPAIILAYCTYDVELLVGYTGAYAGGIGQYVIPVLLVHSARRKAQNTFRHYKNKYASPFSGKLWLILVMIWYLVSLVLVTYLKVKNFLP